MMRTPPGYFEEIRVRAGARWDQLEADPELAGPWHQLFKQVQSPRHVLSELLQNADDANATEAHVHVDDQSFTFSHNGEDFVRDHFASLCRFGYSNKRALHTIGFRGIGFKSTFSLGDIVELGSPSLAVSFDARRFTEPRWTDQEAPQSNFTSVRVAFRDELRRRELLRNLDEWVASPTSLLFFRQIRRLRIMEKDVHWEEIGRGPVEGSVWMGLRNRPGQSVLLASSDFEAFPEESLLEIRKERQLSDAEVADFPPCRVDIVLGAKPRLYVVLPTGVETKLPFAINAPFVQDPARLKIKELEISATNRWLLARAGRLASDVMVGWLQQASLSVQDRSRAYELLPAVDLEDGSLEGYCGREVQLAADGQLADTPFLISDEGELLRSKQAALYFGILQEIWPGNKLAEIFDPMRRPPLSRHVRLQDCEKLRSRGFITGLMRQRIRDRLIESPIPKPETHEKMLLLWEWMAPDLTDVRSRDTVTDYHLVPVQGDGMLYPAREVVRLGQRKLLQSPEDWEFLVARLPVLDQGWTKYLGEGWDASSSSGSRRQRETIETATNVLKVLRLDEVSDASRVYEGAFARLFRRGAPAQADVVRFAQIGAKLAATVSASYRWLSANSIFGEPGKVFLWDDGALRGFVPDDWYRDNVVHSGYTQDFQSCSRDEWIEWLRSGRAGLRTVIPLARLSEKIWGRTRLQDELDRRDYREPLKFRYAVANFLFEDFDFDPRLWRHWQELEKDAPPVWVRVAEQVLRQSDTVLAMIASARVVQISTTGKQEAIVTKGLTPGWALRLRELPCLEDTKAFRRLPAELLRRTRETESLIDVEPFVDRRFDQERTQVALALLGVGGKPKGADGLLVRIRALARSAMPPIEELLNLYRRLDRLIETCSSEEFSNVKAAFTQEPLIFATDGTWTTASNVFVAANEEDVPGAPLLPPQVADLMLWRKIGVAERPHAYLAIRWLSGLPSGQLIPARDLSRVRAVIARHAHRVWRECGHWVNLVGEWTPVGDVRYAASAEVPVAWTNLHESIRRVSANFLNLAPDVVANDPFASIPRLAEKLEEKSARLPTAIGRPTALPWLEQMGRDLARIRLDAEMDTDRVRKLGLRLAGTMWQPAMRIEVLPYIDDTPAGLPRVVDAAWIDSVLYVADRGPASLALAVAAELGRIFGRPEVIDAIKVCYDRTRGFVGEFMESAFDLDDASVVECSMGRAEEEKRPDREFDDGDGKRPVADEAGTDYRRHGMNEDGDLKSHEDREERSEEGDSGVEVTGTETGGFIDDIEPGDEWDSEGRPDSADDTRRNEADEQNESEPDGEVSKSKDKKESRTAVFEKFMEEEGFRKVGGDRFEGCDGSFVNKASGALFAWERWDGSGRLVRCYHPVQHCLEQKPMEIEAERWAMLQAKDEQYALVLLNLAGEAVELRGSRLLKMMEQKRLALHPASYRIAYSHDGVE